MESNVEFKLGGQSIGFYACDEVDYEIVLDARSIVDLMKSNRTLIDSIGKIVNRCKYINENEKLNKLVTSEIKYNREYMFIFYDFKQKFEKYFISSNDNDVSEQEFEEKVDRFNKLRGTILEFLLEEKASELNIEYTTGCKVNVNKKTITYEGRRSVDFAGHNKMRCQFYECKLSPGTFTSKKGLQQIALLKKIKSSLEELKVSSEIFCVSLQNSSRVKTTIEKKVKGAELEEINIWGIEHLY